MSDKEVEPALVQDGWSLGAASSGLSGFWGRARWGTLRFGDAASCGSTADAVRSS